MAKYEHVGLFFFFQAKLKYQSAKYLPADSRVGGPFTIKELNHTVVVTKPLSLGLHSHALGGGGSCQDRKRKTGREEEDVGRSARAPSRSEPTGATPAF